MKKKFLYLLGVIGFLSILFIFLLPLTIVNAGSNLAHKIDICHRTSSHTNPYNLINVDKNATVGGHDDHDGPIWYEGIVGDWGDIIPPYTYYEWEVVGSHEECPSSPSAYGQWAPGKTCMIGHGQNKKYAYPITVDDYGFVEHQYPGKNWTTEGQAIWGNDCYVQCSVTETTYGDWSDWMDDPSDDTQEYRERTIFYVDSEDSQVVCGEETEQEFRYKLCSIAEPVYGDWSEWAVDPSDDTQEFRTRTVTYYDSEDSEYVCNKEVETEYKDIEEEYETCSVMNTVYGDWSEWAVDPSDDTREFRTRTVTYYDSENTEYVCNKEVETEYRDIEDEGEVLGESDEKGEVLGTNIVPADTAGGDTLVISLIEFILVICSAVSINFLLKRKLQIE